MPEGHSVHRIALQFRENFVGERVAVSSPQGRFSAGAALIDGRELTRARAVGKQMFLGFGDLELRVHLGIYGAWDFAGDVRISPFIELHGAEQIAGGARLGQTGEYSRLHTKVHELPGDDGRTAAAAPGAGVSAADAVPVDAAAEDSVFSIGAPRTARLRMAESDRESASASASDAFPPPPVGQVRARLLTSRVCADLRGPTACEVLTPEEAEAVIDRLGPDPANDASTSARDKFIGRAHAKRVSIGQVLMDQSVVAGIGNVYRAEMLFRAGIDPHRPANTLPLEVLGEMWDDWAHLLAIGIRVGQMITIDGLSEAEYLQALRDRDSRHWVYKREGEACKRCGAEIALELMQSRKLYWCPGCQH